MIKLTELRLFDCTAGGTVVPDVFFDNALRTCVADIGEMAKVKIHLQRKKKAAQIQVVSVVEQPAGISEELKTKRFGKLHTGKQIFDTAGNFCGNLTDADFSNSLALTRIYSGERIFTAGVVLSVGKDAIVIKTPSVKSLWKKQVVATQKQKVEKEQQTPQQLTVTKNVAPSTQNVAISNRTVRRRYGNFDFLLHKRVDKTIVNFQGETMIKKGETITEKVLKDAKISGKLVELYLHIE
ncbi:MAG TPA: hypothetical protein IAD47_03925 [Candidatus Limihabitans stercoravium]|nr:hypothetical protein [Candidatus Limihabitans stercoravium]